MQNDRQTLGALLAALADDASAAALPVDDHVLEHLLTVARRHRLSALLSATRGDVLPKPLAAEFKRDRLMTATRNLVLAQVAEQCVRALQADGIPAVVLKGLAYEPLLYRTAGARPTSDVDLLVPNEQRRRAFAVFDRLGFEPRAAAPGFDDADYHEVAWRREGAEVDLHLGLAPFARCDIDYPALWAATEPLRVGQIDARALRADHAAIFHALHMAIDHYDVAAIYLVDLTKLLPAPASLAAAAATARAWRCWRPLTTAVSLAAALLPAHPAWADGAPIERFSRRIAERYGAPVPRPEQLLRKLTHFDSPRHALRYLAVQGRRNLRELVERRVRRRSARARLGLTDGR